MAFSKQALARRLKLQQLAIFEQVLASGSISAASRELHMTQPAISKAIHELEEHFGQALLTRSTRGVQPTAFGSVLRKHCHSLMAGLRLLADDLNAWNEGVSGKVMVGTLLTAAAQVLPRAILRLRDIAPQVVVQVDVGVNEKMFPQLLRGEIDVVVGMIPPSGHLPELVHTPLLEDTLCAVVGRSHPLATQRRIRLEDLRGCDWVLPLSGSQAMRAADIFFQTIGMNRPTRTVESVSILTSLGLLVDSDMIALMSFNVARQFVQLGLISMLPLPQEVPLTQVGYTLVRGRTLSPATQRLLQALEEVALAPPPHGPHP